MFGVSMTVLLQCRAETRHEDLICQSPYHKIVFCIFGRLSEKSIPIAILVLFLKFFIVLFWGSSLSVLKVRVGEMIMQNMVTF